MANLRFLFLVLIPLFAGVAFILSLNSGVWCTNIQFLSTSFIPPSNESSNTTTNNNANNESFPNDSIVLSDDSLPESIRLRFGIWYYQGWQIVENSVQGTILLQTCIPYPESVSIDPHWKAARAFVILTCIIGGFVLLLNCLSGCLYPNKRYWQWGARMYLLCCVMQGLTLLFLHSDACVNNGLVRGLEESLWNAPNAPPYYSHYPVGYQHGNSTNGTNAGNTTNADSTDSADSSSGATVVFPDTCSMGPGAKSGIAATIFWFLAGILALRTDPPHRMVQHMNAREPLIQHQHDFF